MKYVNDRVRVGLVSALFDIGHPQGAPLLIFLDCNLGHNVKDCPRLLGEKFHVTDTYDFLHVIYEIITRGNLNILICRKPNFSAFW